MKNSKGSALLTVLIVMILMSIFGLALMNVSVAENKFAIQQEKFTKAYYIARAGAEATATWVADKSHSLSTIAKLVENNQDNIDSWTDFEEGRFKISFPGGDKYSPTVQSVGEYDGVQRTLQLNLRKRYFFDAAVTAKENLNIENANCRIYGDIALVTDDEGNEAKIKYPNGNHDPAQIIHGSISSTDRNFDPVVIPTLAPATWTNTNLISSGDGLADRYLGSVHLNNGELNINLSGDMELVFNKLSSNNATIKVNGNGNLIIYANEVEFKGNLYTSSGAITTLMIKESGDVHFQTGSSEFQAYIYAPDADVKIKANFGSVGAIIAKNITIESGGEVSYNEENLGNVYPEELGFPSQGYERSIWVE